MANKSQIYFMLAARAIKNTQPVELWLDATTGSDANTGLSAASPLKTLDRAYAKIALYPAGPVRINVAAGDVPWVPVPTFLKDKLILFYGEPGTDVLNETAQAGTGATQIVAASVLVANAQRGRIIEITSGAALGNRQTIRSNTTTDIVPNVAYDGNPADPVPAPGDTFRVYSPGTVFRNMINLGGGGPGPGWSGLTESGDRQGGLAFWCCGWDVDPAFGSINVPGYVEVHGVTLLNGSVLYLDEGSFVASGLDPYWNYFDVSTLVATRPALTAQFGIKTYGGFGLTSQVGIALAMNGIFAGALVVTASSGNWLIQNNGYAMITAGHTPFQFPVYGQLDVVVPTSVACTIGNVAATVAKIRAGAKSEYSFYGNVLLQSSVAGPLVRVQGGLLTIGPYQGFNPSGAAPSGQTVNCRYGGRIICFGPPSIGRVAPDTDWVCEGTSVNKTALAATGSRIADATKPESIILNQGPEFFS